ncbi:MAG: hypothetical protein WBR26_01275 [Candidatus Acidiferrum sp.]
MQVVQLINFALSRQARLAALCVSLLFPAFIHAQATAPQRTPPALGTIKSISADALTLKTDAGAELNVQLPSGVQVFRIPPGSKDLKQAVRIQLSDLQPGDRVLVRGTSAQDPTSFVATAIIAMKAADIASKQEKDRQEWQRHGIGGLVSNVDPAQNTVTIKTLTSAGSKDVVIHTAANTILRRYAPGSVNFDEAKVAPITEIKAGDQLRARGTRSPDGNEFTADEIVSGSFRNIAGIVTAVDPAAGTLTVNDIAIKKPVELKVTADSKMRIVPEQMARGIAMRFKGAAAGASGGATPASQPGRPSQGTTAQGTPSNNPGASAANPGHNGGNGGGDMQQMLARLPVSPLTDFKKGDVVMAVATAGQGSESPTVITLLGGVEPVLQATTQGQASSILTPWSLNEGGGGAEGTP